MTSDRTLNLEALLDLPSPARPLPQPESALTWAAPGRRLAGPPRRVFYSGNNSGNRNLPE